MVGTGNETSPHPEETESLVGNGDIVFGIEEDNKTLVARH